MAEIVTKVFQTDGCFSFIFFKPKQQNQQQIIPKIIPTRVPPLWHG